jgi:zinc/manganese transport system ATP-binding protein
VHHPILRLDGVSFSYGNEYVLRDVSFVVREGAFVGVVGPSGAGKTTLLALMDGTLRPTAGVLRPRDDGTGRRLRLGIVPQLSTIDWTFPVTVEEVVLLGRAADAGLMPWASREIRAEARTLLERLGIGHLAKRHIRDLSGGQQQRAFIARALIRRPDLLLLDEPTSGVDVRTRHDVLHLLHELNHDGIAIVLTTHDLNAVAAHLPSLICLNERLIAAGSPADVLRPDVLRALYGADMIVVERDGMLLIGDAPSAIRERHARDQHRDDVLPAHFGDEPAAHEHGPGADHDHDGLAPPRSERAPRSGA